MVVSLRAQLLDYLKVNVSARTRSSITVVDSGHAFRLQWLKKYYQGSKAALKQYKKGRTADYDIATTRLNTISGLSQICVVDNNVESIVRANPESALVGALYHGGMHYVVLLAYPGESGGRLYNNLYGRESANKEWTTVVATQEMKRYWLDNRPPPESFKDGKVTYRIITMWFYGAQSHL
jgi:hypothetical protein